MSLSQDIQDVLERYRTRQKEAASQKELSSNSMTGTMTSDRADLMRKIAHDLREHNASSDVTVDDIKAFLRR